MLTKSVGDQRNLAQDHPETCVAVISLLTAREREVLGLIAEGFSDRGIAESLRISPLTATTHVKRILHKLHVPSRSAAAAIAVRAELSARGRR
ncbi:MAG TPA: helix-turn-helix transcriptional regulator [Thermomicrobiales bacterium]|nr:helix-turn-helix transcriptional regulator [Thermomicrobiales bacterium]